jgi:DNA repair protein RadC
MKTKNTSIKLLSKVLRPRERLIKKGASILSDDELLAILLGTGSKEMGVLETAKYLIENAPEDDITKFDYYKLTSIKGISQSKATTILASLELGKRLYHKNTDQIWTLETPEDVFQRSSEMINSKKELLKAYYLNVKSEIIAEEIVAMGSIDGVGIHPREIFEPALRYNAFSLIMVHNHPSGDSSPSDEDIKVTQRIIEAGQLIGIEVVDHVIISKSGFFSLREATTMFDNVI